MTLGMSSAMPESPYLLKQTGDGDCAVDRTSAPWIELSTDVGKCGMIDTRQTIREKDRENQDFLEESDGSQQTREVCRIVEEIRSTEEEVDTVDLRVGLKMEKANARDGCITKQQLDDPTYTWIVHT